MDVFYEIIGYTGTALVVISMMMKSMKTLRIINVSGAILSTIYSIINSVWPIAIMNISLILIHLYHLIKERNKQGAVKKLTFYPPKK